ncbi:YceD family protein [Variovorax sp. ZT4R33]|uniref:YceD family protein n=1 Tax=Variovorax sp. ZT4R33 TaxID=3443743 RepID=UPI003F451952
MNREFVTSRLDVTAFATAAAALTGNAPAPEFQRLSAELAEPAPQAHVSWEVRGELRAGSEGVMAPWLHLKVDTVLPFVCQRCLTPVQLPLTVDRSFRFAADEATAALEDESSEEDVLAAERDFDLLGLIEDELLMEVPVTPRHEVCPVPVQLSAVDPDFEQAEETAAKPFAVLGALRGRKTD